MTFDGVRCVSGEGERIKQMRVAQEGNCFRFLDHPQLISYVA